MSKDIYKFNTMSVIVELGKHCQEANSATLKYIEEALKEDNLRLEKSIKYSISSKKLEPLK